MRHLLSGPRISPQTCDKKKIEFLEVNFYDNKKSSDYIGFTDVFEFSSDLKKTMKKTSDVQIKWFLLMFLSVVRALKRVEFEVKILCDFQNR